MLAEEGVVDFDWAGSGKERSEAGRCSRTTTSKGRKGIVGGKAQKWDILDEEELDGYQQHE